MRDGLGETVTAATGLLRALGDGGGAVEVARTYTCWRCEAALAGRAEWLAGGLCGACGRWRSEQDALEQRRRVDERVRAALAGIPARFRGARFGPGLRERVADMQALTVALRVVSDTSQSLPPAIMLHGPPGGGKTTLAAAMLNFLGQRALNGSPGDQRLMAGALWTSAASLGNARCEHGLGDGEAPLLAQARAATLLVVDDLGKEGSHEMRRQAVEEILRDRAEAGAPMIVTTELDGGAVVRAYTTARASGEHLQRRLFAGAAVVIPVGAGRRAA